MGARLILGTCYLDPNYYNGEICTLKKDVVKGWAIINSIKLSANNRDAETMMEDYKEALTSEQLKEANELSKEWIAKKPPLSKFPPMFGF